MREILEQINKRLEKLNFDKLWSGFKAYDYALYDVDNVYFIDKTIPVDNRFMGNTSIPYEGRQIAIWKVSDHDKKNIDLLTAKLVHEMYHAHQLTLKEKRFFSDLESLKYPYVLENYKMKHVELTTLANVQIETDMTKKRELFTTYISIRKEREKLIGSYMTYEKAIETIEGSAEYITLGVLKQLNYNMYAKQLRKACEIVSEVSEKFFDTRRIAYFSGALICQSADDLGIDINCEIGKEEKFIFDLVDKGSFTNKTVDIGAKSHIAIEEMLHHYIEKIKSDINSVIENQEVKEYRGDFSVRGYDPMNMVRYEDKVLHKSFLAIFDGKETNFIMGPVVTQVEGDNYSEFTKYYTS